jgi:TatD DNase family protein
MPNINFNTVSPMLELSNKYKGICFHMLGLHPCYLNENYRSEITKILSFINKETIAIGEIGMDLYHSKDNINNQIDALEVQCEYALNEKLPVVLHTRNSINETIDVISKYKGRLKGVFHCFDGDYEQLKKITNLGFKIGLGGIITFKNSKLKEVISRININDIVLETDSPYLSPEPYRGKRNEPYNISFIADKLSQILSIPYDNVCEVTSENAINLFDLHK